MDPLGFEHFGHYTVTRPPALSRKLKAASGLVDQSESAARPSAQGARSSGDQLGPKNAVSHAGDAWSTDDGVRQRKCPDAGLVGKRRMPLRSRCDLRLPLDRTQIGRTPYGRMGSRLRLRAVSQRSHPTRGQSSAVVVTDDAGVRVPSLTPQDSLPPEGFFGEHEVTQQADGEVSRSRSTTTRASRSTPSARHAAVPPAPRQHDQAGAGMAPALAALDHAQRLHPAGGRRARRRRGVGRDPAPSALDGTDRADSASGTIAAHLLRVVG